MRVPVLTQNARFLARSAAMIAIASVAAGCSSNVMRFQDGLFTSATSSQTTMPAAVPQEQYAQPYPGDAGQQPADVDTTYTSSISRQSMQPVGTSRGKHPVPSAGVGLQPARQPMPQPGSQVAAAPVQPFPGDRANGQVMRQPMPAAASAAVDRTVTGSIGPRIARPAGQVEGWSREGGSELTVRQGETVQSLSRRFNVPVDAIVRTNNLKDANSLVAGQKVVIPSFSRGAQAAATGTTDLPKDRAPSNGLADRLAVLPQSPRAGDRQPNGQAGATPAGTAARAGSVYTVVAGDTLSGIARRMGTTTAAIKQANGLESGMIRIGQKLTIPGSSPERVASAKLPAGVDPIVTGTAAKRDDGDGVAGYTPPVRTEKVIEETIEQAAAAPDATGIGRMRWPARGRVISGFGEQSSGKKNDGIDIALPEGTPVKAAENGIVIYAGDGLKDFGNTVLVRHEDGLVTVYGHASEIRVSRGDTVRRGQEIALSGLTGNAETPKLHFEVRKNSTPVDPARYLE